MCQGWKKVNLPVAILILSLAVLPSLTQYSFAQNLDDIKSQTGSALDWLKDMFFKIIDGVVDPIDVEKTGNPLNMTNQEKEKLKDSGKKILDDFYITGKDAHSLAEAGVEGLSPYDLAPMFIFVISLGIGAFIMIKWGRKIAKHTLTFILVCVGIVVTLAVFGIMFSTQLFSG